MLSLKKLDFACACVSVCVCVCVCVCLCLCVCTYVYVCINVGNKNLNCYNSKSYNCDMYNTISRIDKDSKIHKLKF